MSSRRKSSTPCMVRVVPDLPEERDEAEEVMEISTDKSESPECAEKSQVAEQEKPEDPDQQTFPNPEEKQTPEPLEQEQQSGKEDRPPVIEDVEAREEKDGEEAESDPTSQKKLPRGYECKYCPFSTQNLNDFKEHVDSSHPNVILNPLYLCAVCNFNTKKFDSLTEHNDSQHPGETNFKFKRIKENNQTILEQTIEGRDNSVECEATNEQGESSNSSVFPPCISTTLKTPDNIQSLYRGGDLKSRLDQITAVNINGTVIIPEPTILQGLSHVSPMLQRPPNFNSVPKIAVPLNTTKYNPSLDDNLTLITSFNKFPYPTHAELSWLTAASKHPEDQIKVWFTTQRLKQGITWSPEEVEEARKKMFNGSFPPAHPMFTILPTSSQPSAKASQQQPIVHTTVAPSGHVRTTTSNGFSVVTTTSSPAGVAICSTLKRTLPAHLTTLCGPESKRPIMAVAPHSGDPKDRGLMAPPPPPPPQKDHFPMAPPPVPMEMKRPSVPLMPPPSSSPSLLSKGKMLSTLGSPKSKPVMSRPSIVFSDSLTRRMMAPPPIFAPPFKKSLFLPRALPIASKEKHPNTHPLPASDLKLPNSPPLITPQIRRPTIIQSIRAPAKAPPQILGFSLDGKKLKEQQGVELKASYPRGDKVLTPLTEANGTSRTDGKWPHHQTSALYNNGGIHMKPDFQQKSSVLTQFPLLERMKGKTAEQLKILEENFLRNSFPTHSDVDSLSANTRLSHREIDSWFVERRALRDNLEQALINSMGTKRIGVGGIAALTDKQLHQQQHQTLKLNGIHKPSIGAGHLKSPLLPSHTLPIISPGTIAPPVPNPNPCSVPPDSRSLALLKDDFAQTRWPSPEELNQLEGRTGLARADLARWFNDSRLQSGSMDLTELFNNNGVNGGQGAPVCSPENAPSSIIQRCQEGAITNSSSSKVLELELGWLMEQRAHGLNSQQHDDVHDRFAGRLRQQNVAELKNGGQNGGVVGGAREVFRSWLEDGRSRRGRELLLDRERKMAEDASGRLTG
ncbi:zinc fingers and homeoboxes protein 2 [Hippoglossus stenolepis]|uniref:zinc fingers and homeoboxes protein 2 n=1 Tax=Hippoglossus stenolepis TaxID=195615 RepID=UPI00159C697F|nr:zinc fingers and homeoboxes protein 2 [Hippoglossus stenolepis]XP_035038964.1 zinc fingers and homeoboxes protein 2 [Hippoglossus stenolepis]